MRSFGGARVHELALQIVFERGKLGWQQALKLKNPLLAAAGWSLFL
jgi:hypothetical protein